MRARRRLQLAIGACAAALGVAACGDKPTTTKTAPDETLGRPIGGATTTQATRASDPRRIAREFATAYVQAIYGRLEPSHIPHAARHVRDEVAAQRIPPAQRARRPRITAVRLTRISASELRCQATVDDSDVATYPLFFTLTAHRSGWVATSISD